MLTTGIVEIALSLGVLVAVSRPLGLFVADVLEGARISSRRSSSRSSAPACAPRASTPRETGGKPASAMLAFNLLGVLAVYAIQRLQRVLPLNPQHLGAVAPDVAFNTAVSFASNTNWQATAARHDELPHADGRPRRAELRLGASGMAVLAAAIRGVRAQGQTSIGNFWVDLARTLCVLLPLSFVFALVLVSQGRRQTFAGRSTAAHP